MHSTKKIAFVLTVCSAIAVFGCSRPGPVGNAPENIPPEPEFNREFFAVISQEEGRVFWVDSERSEARFYLWRGGPMAEKGHNHVLRVKKMEGAVFLPYNMLEEMARLEILFRAEDIEVDPMPLRQETGGAFADTALTPEDAQATREHMLGEKVLNAERFPVIAFRAEKILGELPKLVLNARINLHGIERRKLVPATVQVKDDLLTARGELVIKQRDFRIEPFSAMGGALYLKDPVIIEFVIVARAR